MKKRYTVRLYRLHDLDLITFMLSHDFDIVRAFYSTLTAFVKGDVFAVAVPPAKAQTGDIKRVYAKALTLDTEKDRAVIEMLDKINPGYRNNFIKNLLRLYLCRPLSADFLKDPADEQEFSKMFAIFTKDKKIAKAGSRKESKRQKPAPEKEKQKAPEKETVKETAKTEKPVRQVKEPEPEETGIKDDPIADMFAGIIGD